MHHSHNGARCITNHHDVDDGSLIMVAESIKLRDSTVEPVRTHLEVARVLDERVESFTYRSLVDDNNTFSCPDSKAG